MPKKIESLLDASLEKEINKLVKEIEAKGNTLKPRQLKKLNKKLVDEFIKRHKFKFQKDILKFYKISRNKILTKLKKRLDFTARDEAAVELLRNSKVLSKLYSNMDERLTSKINKAITEAIEADAIDFNKLVDKIHKIQNAEYSMADMIARTEAGVVSNIASANTYDQLDKEAGAENLYTWVGPKDARVTGWCAEISELTKHGVTLKELEKIIKKHGDTRLKYRRPFQVHIRCRHTIQPI